MGTSGVSVVIAYYQQGGTAVICDALDSLLRQSAKNFEVVIVDDDSPTGIPPDAQDRLSELNHRIVRLRANVGAGEARNRGVAVTTQPILTFLDHDDLLTDDAIARIAGGVTSGRAVAFDNWLAFRDRDGNLQRLDETIFGRAGWNHAAISPSEQDLLLQSGFPVVKLGVLKEDFVRSGGYPTNVYAVGDFLLVWRLLSRGVTLQFTAPLGTYVLSAESMTATISHSDSAYLRARWSWLRVWSEIAFSPYASTSTRITASRRFFTTIPGTARAQMKRASPAVYERLKLLWRSMRSSAHVESK